MIDVVALGLPFVFRHHARGRTSGECAALRISTLHVTDVRGGFGVAGYQVTAARALQRKRSELAHFDPTDLALLIRYASEPYHDLDSQRLGDLRLHPVTLRTPHGDAGNVGGGWASDRYRDEQYTDGAAVQAVASLVRHVVGCIDVRAEAGGNLALPHVLVPHRAWDRQRSPDPGRETWQSIVLPALEVLRASETRCEVVIGYSTCSGTGRPVPQSWDPSALYDDYGKLLR